MFQTKTPVAVLAGMAVAGSILVAPGVVAAPSGGIAVGWGSNRSGQLGDNSIEYSPPYRSPVPVAVDTSGVMAGKTVTAITAGVPIHVYWPTAMPTAGASMPKGPGRDTAVRRCRWRWTPPGCWPVRRSPRSPPGNCTRARWPTAGPTAGAQLGTGQSTTNSLVPVAVDTSGVLAGKTVTAITAAYSHTCAVADGRAYCWGENYSGQLGNNSISTTLAGAGGGGHLGGVGREDGHRDQHQRYAFVCGGRRPGLLLGRQLPGAVGQQQHHELAGAGGGGHLRGAGR